MENELAPFQRLALAYAPAASRDAWLAVLALDSRLAGVVRSGREPLLTQIRLAWWRERLTEGAPSVEGEPLLRTLHQTFGDDRRALSSLVDAWEQMTGEGPLDADLLEGMAEARADAVALVAASTGADQPEARRLARNWALADLAGHLSHPDERAVAVALARQQDWRAARMPRTMRPLVVLHGLARSGLGRPDHAPPGALALLRAMRLGILGV